eukprot:TRINITY_DN4049_c0_g1_i2.p1 TRINITY_DN4049_c0_g1~~TRINITY_DN4049_c0_g1_i2.p1  ORF type:complete len:102 (-),score=12.81 TRINITY_DN4049_c0_g1_i2:92-397(-)
MVAVARTFSVVARRVTSNTSAVATSAAASTGRAFGTEAVSAPVKAQALSGTEKVRKLMTGPLPAAVCLFWFAHRANQPTDADGHLKMSNVAMSIFGPNMPM